MKNATRYKFEGTREYSSLRRELRQVELEMGSIRSKKQMSVSVENDSLKGKVDKLVELVTSLTSRISSLENNVEALKNSRSKLKGSKDKTKSSGSVESSAPQKSIQPNKPLPATQPPSSTL